ncbi:MAG: four helix bundle protein [Gemmataceae bacterium]|nr:four helix bundle protein [Gemmataceae bacterium]
MSDAKKYDLEERTARFGEAVIAYAKKLPVTPVIRPLIDQIVRAGTSVGANYCEADDAESKKAFRNNICRCRKESRETKHWLRMIGAALEGEELKAEGRVLWVEAKELNLIFSAIVRKCDE